MTIEKQISELQNKIQVSYGVGGWDAGFEFSTDFKAIVPKPQTWPWPCCGYINPAVITTPSPYCITTGTITSGTTGIGTGSFLWFTPLTLDL